MLASGRDASTFSSRKHMTDSSPRVALVCVASGGEYVAYAERMFASAELFFLAGMGVRRDFMLLEGRHGWPAATMYRYHVVLEHAERLTDATHIFMIDADMAFVAPVDTEIIAPLVATAHPGYVNRRGNYESRPVSAACVADGEGTTYFCGGFVGGARLAFLRLARSIQSGVDRDAANDVIAVWHDESHLNRYLVEHPPAIILSPSYCYPQNDRRYIRSIWPERYTPRIVALEKRKRFSGLRRSQ
jgi:histo-blood group ABO system transferase